MAFTKNGNREIYRNLQRTLDLVLKRAELSHCGLPVLRHTFGSILLSKGVEISAVSYLMGHSSTKIIYDKYIYVFEKQKVEALKILDIT